MIPEADHSKTTLRKGVYLVEKLILDEEELWNRSDWQKTVWCYFANFIVGRQKQAIRISRNLLIENRTGNHWPKCTSLLFVCAPTEKNVNSEALSSFSSKCQISFSEIRMTNSPKILFPFGEWGVTWMVGMRESGFPGFEAMAAPPPR